MGEAQLRKQYEQYAASFWQESTQRVFMSGWKRTQKQAVLVLWQILNDQGIEAPRNFTLTGDLHKEHLTYLQRED